MGYTNSSLASYRKISPNRNAPRNHAIDRVSVHCYVGQASVEDMAGWLCNSAAQASCNYGIGADGRIALIVEESDRSWCTSSRENDNRAVTIECASDKSAPYAVNDKVYKALINLLEDICRRNGKSRLVWIEDKEKALSYTPKTGEMLMTVHRWFAAKECPGEYLFSRHGQIAAEVNERLAGKTETPQKQPETEKQPKKVKMWMGWTKRESGTAGFKQTNGDSGNAYGKYQFDRRYALVPFMKYCVDYNNKHYGAFNEFITYGAGSVKLLNNASLAKVWADACAKYPAEFETLQDIYAYNAYYTEAARYMSSLYGIKTESRSPALRGTLFSMSIRSGALCAANKFAGAGSQMSDETLMGIAYSSYGLQDAGRWTKAGQWGDALAALKSGEGVEIPVDASQIPKEEAQKVEEKKTLYRVRLKWGADMTTQIGAFYDLEKAKECADNAAAKCYKVYDENGREVYDAGKITPARQKKIAVQWAKDTAKDAAHGYDNSESGRGGPDFACSSFVNEAYRQAGVELPESAGIYTAKMRDIYAKAGFADVSAAVDFKTGKGIEAGDVLLKPGAHVEIADGKGNLIGARGNEKGGMTGGKVGDQTGGEIACSGYWNYPWTYCLRLGAEKVQEKPESKPEQKPAEKKKLYRVRLKWGSDMLTQIGAFEDLDKAKECARNAVAKGYKVFNEAGEIVFTTGEPTPADRRKIASDWILKAAKDPAHGYNSAAADRGGPDFACGSLVNESWREAGLDLPTGHTVYASNMYSLYVTGKKGFKDITAQSDLKTGKGAQAGDIFLAPTHVEMADGKGHLTGAKANEKGGSTGGQPGDQTGNEISTGGFWSYPWKWCLRYDPDPAPVMYYVMGGVFKTKKNALKRQEKLKNLGFDAILKLEPDEKYHVQCGAFSSKKNAQALQKKIIEAGFNGTIEKE